MNSPEGGEVEVRTDSDDPEFRRDISNNKNWQINPDAKLSGHFQRETDEGQSPADPFRAPETNLPGFTNINTYNLDAVRFSRSGVSRSAQEAQSAPRVHSRSGWITRLCRTNSMTRSTQAGQAPGATPPAMR